MKQALVIIARLAGLAVGSLFVWTAIQVGAAKLPAAFAEHPAAGLGGALACLMFVSVGLIFATPAIDAAWRAATTTRRLG